LDTQDQLIKRASVIKIIHERVVRRSNGQGKSRRTVCLPRAPHPAATGGGFGFGKFRRDEQGCLVQKLESGVHLSFLVDRIRHLTSVPAAEECFSPNVPHPREAALT
jgi:hypothetical protein